MAFPSLDSARTDILILASQIGRNGQFGLRTTIMQDVFKHLVVAIRCFDEELRLVFGIDTLLQLLQLLGTLGRFDRQIAVECKALSVESGAHHR